MNPRIPNRSPQAFRRRRLIHVGLFVLAMMALVALLVVLEQGLRRVSYFSGYLLFAAIVFLTLFNVRKKLTFLPLLGSSSFWMQLHIYVGLSTAILLGFHVSWQLPNGPFELFLASLFLAVFGSGLYGLYITRSVPRKLASLNTEVLFERIPLFQKQIAAKAREMVLESAHRNEVIGRFYVNHLAPFLEKKRPLAYLVAPSSRRCKQLVRQIEDLDRYLDESDRETSRELSQLVKTKDDIDYHFAMQGRLKLWLFVHVSMTYSLLLVAAMHAVLAHAFAGGMR